MFCIINGCSAHLFSDGVGLLGGAINYFVMSNQPPKVWFDLYSNVSVELIFFFSIFLSLRS